MVFSMASNRRNKLAKLLLIRALTHSSEILKKYSYLILTPSTLVAKKVKPREAP